MFLRTSAVSRLHLEKQNVSDDKELLKLGLLTTIVSVVMF